MTVNVHTHGVRLVGVACCQPWCRRNHSHQQIKVMLPRISARTNCPHVFEDKGDVRALLMANPFSLYCPKALRYAST